MDDQLENTDLVLNLCKLGICISMAQARYMVSTLDLKRIEHIIKKKQLELGKTDINENIAQ